MASDCDRIMRDDVGIVPYEGCKGLVYWYH